MYTDVVDLRDFYATRLGQVARRLLRRRALHAGLPGRRAVGDRRRGVLSLTLDETLDETLDDPGAARHPRQP